MGVASWLNQHVAPRITALGVTPRSVTLEVRGRRSGRPIRLSLSPVVLGGRRYLVSLAGERAWVRNVRAAGLRAVLVHGRRRPVELREVPVDQRAPILLAYADRRAFTRSPARAKRLYFGKDEPTLDDMEAMAERFPVFEILETPSGG